MDGDVYRYEPPSDEAARPGHHEGNLPVEGWACAKLSAEESQMTLAENEQREGGVADSPKMVPCPHPQRLHTEISSAPALPRSGPAVDSPVGAGLAAVLNDLGNKPVSKTGALSGSLMQPHYPRWRVDVDDERSLRYRLVERRFIEQFRHDATLERAHRPFAMNQDEQSCRGRVNAPGPTISMVYGYHRRSLARTASHSAGHRPGHGSLPSHLRSEGRHDLA